MRVMFIIDVNGMNLSHRSTRSDVNSLLLSMRIVCWNLHEQTSCACETEMHVAITTVCVEW